MRVLFVADGGKELNSFVIRGRQLAEAIGARAVFRPTPEDLATADIIVAVKRCSAELARAIRKTGKPWVYDILDCWGQPRQSKMKPADARAWLRSRINELEPTGLVCTTTTMLTDICPRQPALVLPHHGWARSINPIRDEAAVIGYEGHPRYLEGWHETIERVCDKRRLSFFANPSDFGSIDIVLAVRGEAWDGYPSRSWKSNVKVANAQITGTPVIAMAEAGCQEFESGGEEWIDGPRDLEEAVDRLLPWSVREDRAKRLLAGAITIGSVAGRYRHWLEQFA